MLNGDAAQKARDALKKSVERLTAESEQAMSLSLDLYDLRSKSSKDLIPQIEAFINSLAARPKEFDKTFQEYKVELKTFEDVVQSVDKQRHDAEVRGGTAAGIGTAAGAATAFAAPAAAMAVATTFGTASTGTAISALSGAAATKAALAWLGGGALAAGGSGVAGGTSLLALAGPVGLGLAALCVVGGAAYVRKKNAQIAEEAGEKRKGVEAHRRKTKAVALEIEKLRDLTKMQVSGMRRLLVTVKDGAPRDYREFDDSRKQTLAALVNHVHVLGALLNKRVGSDNKSKPGPVSA
jgi:hypothetical protein